MSDTIIEGAPEQSVDPVELEQQIEWFKSEGIPIPESLEHFAANPEPEPEPVAASEPEPAAEPDPEAEPERGTEAHHGWQQRREGLKRAHERTVAENNRLRAIAQATYDAALELYERKIAAGQPAAPPPKPPEPEEPELDLLEQPDQFIDRRVEQKMKPLLEVVAKLLNERKASSEQAAVEKVLGAIRHAREEYGKQDPDVGRRLEAFQSGYMSDLIAVYGMDERAALEEFTTTVNGIMARAMGANKNPIAALDHFARRFASGAPPQQPAAEAPKEKPRRPRPVSDVVDSALAAAKAGVARPAVVPSEGVEVAGISIDDVAHGRVKPQQIKEMLNRPHGREDFFALLQAAEEQGL